MRSLFWVLPVLAMACGKPRLDAVPGDPAGDPSPADATTDTLGDPTPADEAGDPVPPLVWHEVRGITHVHSIRSHDACDDNPMPGGQPNLECLAQLRAAPCQTGLEFVALTDHPSQMRDYTLVENLLYDAAAGDELVLDGSDPIGNRVRCPDNRRVLFVAGFESTHGGPLGFRRMPTDFGSITDLLPLEEVQARVQNWKDAGAVASIIHSEEPDLTAQRIVDAGAEAMEWYNPHGNFLSVLGADLITGNPLDVLDLLKGMDSFFLGSSSGAHPDLLYLDLLTRWPIEGFAKWREVLRQKPITGLLGTDVHRNVSVDPVCSGSWQAACEAAALLYPHTLTLLLNGGPVMLSDNDRLDSYARLMRWLENRVLVHELTPDELTAAWRAGRGYSVFTVFGDPEGFAFTGQAGARPLVLGDHTAGPATLTVQLPARPVARFGAPFTTTEADAAELRAVLWRTDAAGTTEVGQSTTRGGQLVVNLSTPGAYWVELWLVPRHLTAALANKAALADHEYMWLITNPIHISP